MTRDTARRADVSVVIPFHGTATPLVALESVAAQTQGAREVILVDDASPPEALASARLSARDWPFPLNVVRHEHNRGPGEARNTGWATATSEYVAFLDADDAWHPEKLAIQTAWMVERPEYAWSAHRCGTTRVSGPGATIRHRELRPRNLLFRNVIATPTVVCRRGLAPRFRAGWRFCEDLMLWLDWLDAGHRGAILDASLATLGRPPGSPGGLTGMREAMHHGELRVVDTLHTEGRISTDAAAGWRTVMRLKYLLRRQGR